MVSAWFRSSCSGHLFEKASFVVRKLWFKAQLSGLRATGFKFINISKCQLLPQWNGKAVFPAGTKPGAGGKGSGRETGFLWCLLPCALIIAVISMLCTVHMLSQGRAFLCRRVVKARGDGIRVNLCGICERPITKMLRLLAIVLFRDLYAIL